jgi:anthranilate synthase
VDFFKFQCQHNSDYFEIPMTQTFITQAGATIHCSHAALAYSDGIKSLIQRLDTELGAVFVSGYEYPGRYACWDIGFVNPPLKITYKSDRICFKALNQRGEVLVNYLAGYFSTTHFEVNPIKQGFELGVPSSKESHFPEEERSHQPSVFTIIRAILTLFKVEGEEYLGLYGAFGYDLIFQFEDIKKQLSRNPEQRDMVLYLPDEIYVVDHRKETAFIRKYDFVFGEKSTEGLTREVNELPHSNLNSKINKDDLKMGEYAQLVNKAKQSFARGDLFEVVLSQTFTHPNHKKPSELFLRMCEQNPSPYGFFINLGELEFLVGASPEMYVRLHGKRVETCPISGTIARGKNAMEDSINIQTLLASAKEASELTMCTDVDRNDKSRICEPGSVHVIGRRQIELYSRVIHTVDHVEGYLREGYDAVDAFLSHMWVVTVTGAPKLWAMRFIEEHEKTARQWYGGAVGWFTFDGNLNSGLVLRTIFLHGDQASIRVGATLLYDSEPEAEEEETHLKAAAFVDILKDRAVAESFSFPSYGKGKRVLLIDHQDSFVHTLGNYIRQTGATVITVRSNLAQEFLNKDPYDLVLLSPGPGRPGDFDLSETIAAILKRNIPIFGVCLGLQGLVEYYGGSLCQLDYPMHGKSSTIRLTQLSPLWDNLEEQFIAGRYHSLYAEKASLPQEFEIIAESEEGIIMAIQHKNLPIYAVQFHPETILSLPKNAGLQIMINLMKIIINE